MSNIRCLVYGDTVARTFEIQIQESDSVMRLKDLIKIKKHPRFDDISADELDLYPVDIEMKRGDKSPQEPILDEESLLFPTDQVRDCLPPDTQPNHIYVIVKRPPPPGK